MDPDPDPVGSLDINWKNKNQNIENKNIEMIVLRVKEKILVNVTCSNNLAEKNIKCIFM